MYHASGFSFARFSLVPLKALFVQTVVITVIVAVIIIAAFSLGLVVFLGMRYKVFHLQVLASSSFLCSRPAGALRVSAAHCGYIIAFSISSSLRTYLPIFYVYLFLSHSLLSRRTLP